MNIIQNILVGLVALIHIYILVLEMILWTKPKGIKTFGLKSKEFAEDTKVLAANQGLYNGFLATGLIWSLLDNGYGNNIAIFFSNLCDFSRVLRVLFNKEDKNTLYSSDTRNYRINFNPLKNLQIRMDSKQIIDTITTYATEYGLKILAAIIIWIIGSWIIKRSNESYKYCNDEEKV